MINTEPLKSWSQLNIYTSRNLCKFQDDGKKKAIIQKCHTKLDYIFMWIFCSPTPSSFSHASNTHFSFKSTSTKIPWNIRKYIQPWLFRILLLRKCNLSLMQKTIPKITIILFFCNCDYTASHSSFFDPEYAVMEMQILLQGRHHKQKRYQFDQNLGRWTRLLPSVPKCCANSTLSPRQPQEMFSQDRIFHLKTCFSPKM